MSVKVPESPVLPLTPEQERIRAAKEEWRRKAAAAFAKTPPWRKDFTTISSAAVNTLGTPDDLPGFDFDRDLGWPGSRKWSGAACGKMACTRAPSSSSCAIRISP